MNLSVIADEYRTNGVIRLRSLFAPDEVAEIRTQIDDYVRDVVPGLPECDRVMEADGESVRNLWRMEKYSTFFRELGHRDKLLSLAETLANGPCDVLGVECFCKPAKVGSGVPPHQDNAYFCKRPPDVFTLWVGIDPATEANGAVQYALGSHHTLLPHAPSGVAGNSMGMIDPVPADAEIFRGDLEPGDALAHHCQIIHFSTPNKSEHPRLGMLIVYAARHAEQDSKLHATYTKANA